MKNTTSEPDDDHNVVIGNSIVRRNIMIDVRGEETIVLIFAVYLLSGLVVSKWRRRRRRA